MQYLRKTEMSKESRSQVNLENLKFINKHLSAYDWFIFFGTLLGTVRDGRLIYGDDDIDIYVPHKNRQNITDLLVRNGCTINDDRCPYFLQVTRQYNGEVGFIDLYFYELVGNIIVEKYNFSGNWSQPSKTLHIPVEIIFPVQQSKVDNVTVNIPKWPKACVEYIYGRNWKKPISKQYHYKVDVIDNVPVLRLTNWKEKVGFFYRKRFRPFVKGLLLGGKW